MYRILIVEDEKYVIEVVEAYLQKEGFEVITALDGNTALKLFYEKKPQFVILDLMLPDINGEDICKTIRKESNVPILMLTAKSSVDDRIIGLSLGADDYLIKPFSPRELVMRVKTIMRRTVDKNEGSNELNINDLTINLDEHCVYKKGESIELTPIQYKLLLFFINNPKIVFSRNDIIDKVFGVDFQGYDRTIDAHIKNIRRKIEDNPKEPIYIKTVFGFGYKFEGERYEGI